jgi:hypothetical protein
MTKKLYTCAKSPCKTCPYRRDVPSGLWAKEEYKKLPTYDGEVFEQLEKNALGRFDCHQRDGHMCAGWIAVHGAANLLALRLTRNVAPEVFEYKSPVPVFGSGAEAAKHGMRDIKKPGPEALKAIARLNRKRARDGNWT